MNRPPEHVLVTGGAGYIGSHTCKQLSRRGYVPIVFDDLSAGHRDVVRYGPFVEGSLFDTALLSETLRASNVVAVVHFAASAYVGESMTDPQKYFRNNVAGTVSLIDAMRQAGTERIVFSSTCATYGHPDALPIREDALQRPVNPYGESKLFIERMLKWNALAGGLKYVSLRYFNAAGADIEGELGEFHDPEPHLIPNAIGAALGQRGPLEVYGTDYPTADGTAVRDYTHVDDLAAAHIAALEFLRQQNTSDVFNLGSGNGTSVKELIRAVRDVSGRDVPYVDRPRRPGDPAVLIADPGKAAAALNWRAERSDLSTIVETAWRWYERKANATREPANG